ncbi:hypothetical protein [Pedobacter nyackensis]|uniref:PD-(D/E)XK nuclease superfamily protein n=1 Tax=Pedobacter nyackensis TaxID=475255 RepID=A0A1W1ZVK7_9SPHI|nr:hypothetical protein [Pedobacter nyackensis]SMC52505.1 hypothetical protein SAMN04488101_10189 [Pedobacter nyackensis]
MEILEAINPNGEPVKVDYAFYPSVLDAFIRYKKADDDETFDSLLNRINKVKTEQTEDQLRGVQFESDVNAILKGGDVSSINYTEAHKQVAARLINCTGLQEYIEVVIRTRVGNVKLYGIVDYMFDEMAVDLKGTSNYKLNKYKDSTQHPIYSLICKLKGKPLKQFKYLVTDYEKVFQETYIPSDNMFHKLIYLIYEFVEFIEHYKANITDKKIFGLEINKAA